MDSDLVELKEQMTMLHAELKLLNAKKPVKQTAEPSPWFEVGAFYWTALAPDIVNSEREEQGLI
jgi:hypothetical protein